MFRPRGCHFAPCALCTHGSRDPDRARSQQLVMKMIRTGALSLPGLGLKTGGSIAMKKNGGLLIIHLIKV